MTLHVRCRVPMRHSNYFLMQCCLHWQTQDSSKAVICRNLSYGRQAWRVRESNSISSTFKQVESLQSRRAGAMCQGCSGGQERQEDPMYRSHQDSARANSSYNCVCGSTLANLQQTKRWRVLNVPKGKSYIDEVIILPFHANQIVVLWMDWDVPICTYHIKFGQTGTSVKGQFH